MVQRRVSARQGCMMQSTAQQNFAAGASIQQPEDCATLLAERDPAYLDGLAKAIPRHVILEDLRFCTQWKTLLREA